MSRSDARKREIQDRINAMHDAVDKALMGAWPHPPTEPRDQEPDMTSPTQRRHDEVVTLLTEIRDRLPDAVTAPKRECTDHARLSESSVNVTEAPEMSSEAGNPSTEDRGEALCSSCDAVRHMSDPEPVDVTEEPPVGYQVTDRDGDVWERRETGWAVWYPDPAEWDSGKSAWVDVRQQGRTLHPTTDADRERVGIAPAPDVDPDEVERLTRERDEARHHHEALRTDVKAYINRVNPTATERAMGRWLLARDDERGRNA